MAAADGCGQEVAGVALDLVLAEVASARAARSLARCAAVLDAVEGGAAPMAEAAPITRALYQVERLAAGTVGDQVDAGRLVERLATLHLIASPSLACLHTRIPALPATPLGARCVLAAAAELLQVLEGVAIGDADGDVDASLWVVTGSGFLTLAGTVAGSDRPVPDAAGADALARLARLAQACGGTVRRRHDDEGVKVGVALGSWILSR